MNQQSSLKYFVALAIAFGIQFSIIAETTTETTSSTSLNVKSRLASPWERAVLRHTLDSGTKVKLVKFSPDGKLLASVEGSQISLWQTATGEIQRILPGHATPKSGMNIAPIAIAFSPDSRFLATATWSQGLLAPDDPIIVWDVVTGEQVWQLPATSGCRQVLFDRQGGIIYTACNLGVTAWSFPEGKKLLSFDTEYPLEAIALSPDGQVMATVDANTNTMGETQQTASKTIQLWQIKTDPPVLLKVLDGHVNDIAQVEFTADGTRLVSSSYDGKINVWHWQRGEILPQTNNLYSDHGLFSLSANSRLIAGNFHSSAMTNLMTGLPLRNIMAISDSQDTKMLAFSPQGQLFARVKSGSDSSESQIDLWQAEAEASSLKQENSIKDNYQVLPLAQYWDRGEQLTEISPAEQVESLPSSIGKDPQAIAWAALGLKETVELEQEQIQLDYPQNNLAVVTITQTNLGDDSVKDRRYLVKFAPYGETTQQQWQVVWAGQQFRCQANRGNQDWHKNLCQ